MSEPTVTIKRGRLKELLEAEAKLNALEAGGVDNWEWYDDSLEDNLQDISEAEIDKEATSE